MSRIYKNEDGYRVLAERFTDRESIKKIEKILKFPIKMNMTNNPPYLLINYEKVYKGDWVTIGVGQVEFEIFTNKDFKKRFKLYKWMKMKR